MRVLVTGGAGFIGSNLVDALLERGDDVSVVDNLSTGRRENLDGALAAGARLHEASITDGEAMTALLAEERPEAVFHLAAQIDVRRAVEDPAYDAAVNVGGTAVVLDAARAAGTRRFLLASTGGAIYGDCDRLPTPEDAPAAPISPYGASKAAAETYLALYRRLHGLSTCALRLANVYGPRQDPLGEGGVVAIYCHAAANRKAVRCSATGARRATSSTSATWRRRSSRRRSATSPARTTSARARRRACSTSWSASGSRPASSRSGRARSSAPPSTRARRARHWAGAPRWPLADGLERTMRA